MPTTFQSLRAKWIESPRARFRNRRESERLTLISLRPGTSLRPSTILTSGRRRKPRSDVPRTMMFDDSPVSLV